MFGCEGGTEAKIVVVRRRLITLAVIVVAAGVAVAVIVSVGGGAGKGRGNGSGTVPRSSVPTLREQTGLPARREIADVRAGIAVYSDNFGTGANRADIPIGRGVTVVCVASNYSDITSINSFYLVATPPWRGLFASANQFANGAPVGVTTNSDPVDPHLRKCRTG